MITVANIDSSLIKMTASHRKIRQSASLHVSANQERNLRTENRFSLLKCSSSISFGVAKHSGVTVNKKVSLPWIELRKFGLPWNDIPFKWKNEKTLRLANWKKQHHAHRFHNPLRKNSSYDPKPTQADELLVEIQNGNGYSTGFGRSEWTMTSNSGLS